MIFRVRGESNLPIRSETFSLRLAFFFLFLLKTHGIDSIIKIFHPYIYLPWVSLFWPRLLLEMLNPSVLVSGGTVTKNSIARVSLCVELLVL